MYASQPEEQKKASDEIEELELRREQLLVAVEN
jgi:hypothetical protein